MEALDSDFTEKGLREARAGVTRRAQRESGCRAEDRNDEVWQSGHGGGKVTGEECRSWRQRRSHSGSWEYPEGKSGFGERSGKMGCRRAGGCPGRSHPRAVTRGATGSGWRSTAERRPESPYCGNGGETWRWPRRTAEERAQAQPVPPFPPYGILTEKSLSMMMHHRKVLFSKCLLSSLRKHYFFSFVIPHRKVPPLWRVVLKRFTTMRVLFCLFNFSLSLILKSSL